MCQGKAKTDTHVDSDVADTPQLAPRWSEMGLNDPKLNDEAARMRALLRYSVLNSSSEPQFESIVDLIQQTLRVPMCAVSFIDQDDQWLKAERGLGISQVPRHNTFCNHAIRQDDPLVIPDAKNDPRTADHDQVCGPPHIRSYLGIPLRTVEGYHVGSVCVLDTTPRDFSPSEIAILSRFAGLVVENLELRMMASTDALTGLRTRRDWQERVRREIKLMENGELPLSVAILDIDHFKVVNDTHGHPIGDLVLAELSSILQSNLRSTDLVGRIGGEEFVVALSGTGPKEALVVLERIRREVARALMPPPVPQDVRVTISGGIAQLRPNETLDDVYLRADTALYSAKSAGRNQIVTG